MTSPTGPQSSPVRDTAPLGGLQVHDVVALLQDLPEWDLKEGTWGAVMAIHEDGMCDVEFTDQLGEPIRSARVEADWVELLWSEAEE